jgi:Ca2+-binding EF-hand superfamily protein
MIAAAAVGAASQLLSTLLSKLSSSSATSSSSSTSSTTTAATSAFQQAMPGAGKSATSAPPTSPLSGDMLMALMSLQAQNGGGAASTSSQGSAANPVQQLFSAMDSDGDGEVSQNEMESYIEKQGGTQAQADSLFGALNQTNSASSGSSGISESQMASAVSQAQQTQQAHGAHRHHHHKSGGTNDQADTTASSLLQALDGDDDGSVSEDELTNFVTANGGTPADASSDFTALNTSGSNALTSADFAKAFNTYQTQQNAQSPGSMVVSLLNQLAGANGGTSISA